MADPSLSLTDTRARLLEHFSVYPDHDLSGWSKLWDAGNFLPFDRGCPNPALEDVLVQRGDLIGTATHHINGEKLARRKRALVPGCGRGYDVLLLASFGYDAYGLEISETAVRRAKEEQEKHSDRYPTRDETIGAGTAYFFQGDFFDPETWVSSIGRAEVSEGFDVIYDYTVRQLCLHHLFRLQIEPPLANSLSKVFVGSAPKPAPGMVQDHEPPSPSSQSGAPDLC